MLISAYNSNPNITLSSDKRNKTTTIGIKSIDIEDLSFNSDKCLLLKVTAFKTNLIDGYYQSANEEEKEIRFKERDKIYSDTYFFILYPLLNIQAEKGLKIDVYWHIFIYEDPSKTNDEMARIACLIMSKIMKAPIKSCLTKHNADYWCNTAVAKSLLTTSVHSTRYLCINQIRNN